LALHRIKLLPIKNIGNAGRKKNKAFAYRIYLHFTQQCMVKVEIPLKPSILFLFDRELCETVYQAAGAPHQTWF
jgi:hypothetical protein